jgi:hypothetical protein
MGALRLSERQGHSSDPAAGDLMEIWINYLRGNHLFKTG